MKKNVAGREKGLRLQNPFLSSEVDFDEWVRHVVSIHFHPEHGAPYWVERARELKIDAGRDIRGFSDLAVLGFFDTRDLRQRDVRAFLPAALARDPGRLRVYETGGTTGAPGRIAVEDYWRLQVRWMDWFFDALLSFPRDVNWLWAGPTGPHVVGDLCRDLANRRGGMCFFVDMDSRFVKALVKKGDRATLEAYQDHVRRQVYAILETQEVGVFSTTPALMQTLGADLADDGYEFKGLLYGGTHLPVDVYRLLRTEFFPGAVHASGYGNTLMGNALLRPYRSGEEDVVYYPLWPHFVLEVVDPDTPERVVGYGERGRVRFSTVSEELLLPWVLERDEAVRWRPIPELGWDGVGNVRPLQSAANSIVEGVY